MAHRFDNFDDAFAEWTGFFDSFKNWVATAGTHAQAAFDGCPNPVDRTHFYRLYDAVQSIRSALTVLTNTTWPTWDTSNFYESIYWANKDASADYELTLFKMVNAMLDGLPPEIELFVGITDAYRQSIWNRPFNQQLFANLARSFETWL